jgi:hypoxanthine phosphoribosyltransferase
MFDINKSNTPTDFNVNAIYDGVDVDPKTPDQCDCHTKGKSYVIYRSDLSIEMASGIPTIRQMESSNLSELLIKNNILRTSNKKWHDNIEPIEMRSRIDDDKLTEFELVQYWKQLEKVFQLGHVERGDTHFEHYDIPERLLFDKHTRSELEAYIKQFVWSYSEEINYVIYNKDLTAAMLAHIVASRFLKKPEVVEAVKYSDGSFVLPRKVSQSLDKKKVLLVDDSINTGATMIELIGLVNMYGGTISGIFTITNRTSPEIEIALRKMVSKVACAYRFNLPTHKKSKCNLCSYKKTIESYIEHTGTKEITEYLNSKLPLITIKPYDKT